MKSVFAHRHKAFDSAMKNFLLSDEKRFCSLVRRGRGFVFASAKNGNECDLKILSSSSSFLHLFSLTPIGVLFVCLFVRLFVFLRAREEACVKCSFSSLCNTFFGTQKAQFLQHNLRTVFTHNLRTVFVPQFAVFVAPRHYPFSA